MDSEFFDFENNDFVLIINDCAVMPIEKIEKGIIIEIIDDNKKCLIDGNSYSINDEKLRKIKESINNNINKLVHFSMLETSSYLKDNIVFGENKSLYVKIGLLNLSINGSDKGEVENYLDGFINMIIQIIKNDN